MSNWPAAKARRVLAALSRIGWQIKRQSGSHRTPARLGNVVVMTSQHEPDRGRPLQITRVWVNRNGVWQSTLSYQTSID